MQRDFYLVAWPPGNFFGFFSNSAGLERPFRNRDPVSAFRTRTILTPAARSGRNADPNGRFQIIGGNAAQENAYYKTDYNNFAPTVGIAYTPNFESGIGRFLFGSEGKSVLRGGYSQAYVNDSILTALSGADGSNVGLGSTPAQAVFNGSANLNLRLSGARPTIAPPVFNGPPN